MAADAMTTSEHATLDRLLDRSRFVGIRIFGSNQQVISAPLADISPEIKDAARAARHQHVWPQRGESHQNWIDVAGERLIQVVLPLMGQNGNIEGYLEGVSRLDEQALMEQLYLIHISFWSGFAGSSLLSRLISDTRFVRG